MWLKGRSIQQHPLPLLPCLPCRKFHFSAETFGDVRILDQKSGDGLNKSGGAYRTTLPHCIGEIWSDVHHAHIKTVILH